LIELLVVIAIIAILVVIVVVAINPVGRLQEANDKRTSANVRAAGSLIGACITDQLSRKLDPFVLAGCASTTAVGTALGSYGTLPPTSGPAAIDIRAATDSNLNGIVQICATADNPGGSGNIRWQSSNGDLELPADNPTLDCPDI